MSRRQLPKAAALQVPPSEACAAGRLASSLRTGIASLLPAAAARRIEPFLQLAPLQLAFWYCAALAVAALTTAYFARQAAMERAHFAAGAGRGCGAKDCRQTSLVVPWPVSRIAALPLLHPRVMSGAEHVAALLPGTFPVA